MSESTAGVTRLLETVQDDPGAVDVDEVLEYLDSEQGRVRGFAMKTLVYVAQDDVDRVLPVVDDVIESLEDPFLLARQEAAMVLDFVARADPGAVEPGVPALVDMLGQDPPMLRFRAAGALAPLAAETVEPVVEEAEGLVDVVADGPRVENPDPDELDVDLTDSQREKMQDTFQNRQSEFQRDKQRSLTVRETALNLLVEVAAEEPAAFADRADELVPELSAEHESIRAAAVDVFGTLAQADPAHAEPAEDDIVDLLDDPSTMVRARAVRALGHAEVGDAVDPLREVAEDEDADEELRGLAADTADWLEDNAQ